VRVHAATPTGSDMIKRCVWKPPSCPG
jgi:hypothetical protein